MAEDTTTDTTTADTTATDQAATTEKPSGTDAATATQDADRKFTQADLDRIVADRVKRERDKYADYPDLKKKAAAAMTDQEKAVADAEERGKKTALDTTAKRLARAEFRATAKGRVADDTLDGFLEYADPAKFVGDDGEPDMKAIEAAVKKLAGSGRSTDFDGGARTTAKTNDMNSLIRHKANRG